jgi:hypothetical protein
MICGLLFSKFAGSSRKMNLAYQIFVFSRHEDFMTATSLQITARLGFFVFVKDILDGGADINAQGGRYGNALQAAASSGNEAVVRLLVDKGADVNAQVVEYGNALCAAASSRERGGGPFARRQRGRCQRPGRLRQRTPGGGILGATRWLSISLSIKGPMSTPRAATTATHSRRRH